MSDLNYVVVKCGISRYKKLLIILRKNIVARRVEFYYKRPTD